MDGGCQQVRNSEKNMLRRTQLLQKNARYAELQVDDDIKKAFFCTSGRHEVTKV